MLTLEKLKQMQPHEIIASGTIENSPQGIYMTDSNAGRLLLWVAKRGGIHDWAIYIHWNGLHDIEWVINYGDKVTSIKNIKKLVPCDEQALSMYRL